MGVKLLLFGNLFKCLSISFKGLQHLHVLIFVNHQYLRIANVKFPFKLLVFSLKVDYDCNQYRKNSTVFFNAFGQEGRNCLK